MEIVRVTSPADHDAAIAHADDWFRDQTKSVELTALACAIPLLIWATWATKHRQPTVQASGLGISSESLNREKSINARRLCRRAQIAWTIAVDSGAPLAVGSTQHAARSVYDAVFLLVVRGLGACVD